MNWLWLVSVGISDVQFPVWKQDEYGQWKEQVRAEWNRSGIRAIHEKLVHLLRNGKIKFEDKVLPSARDISRELRFSLEVEGDSFLAAVEHPGKCYRISNQSNEIPNEYESTLSLHCPKVAQLVEIAQRTFGDRVTVVVLNTRREKDFSEARDEPISSGPLVAKYLAERLRLEWIDTQGKIPDTLPIGVSTWVDVLTDREAMEDFSAQRKVIERLTSLFFVWNQEGIEQKIVVTTSGGMPPLKPIFERIPAICVGQENVHLLEQPERGPAVSKVLDYSTKVIEKEILRFHCAEALRNQDYQSAYGLAKRATGQPWADQVQEFLEPLLGLSVRSLRRTGGRSFGKFATRACQIELYLAMEDVANALKQIAPFLEAATWALMEKTVCTEFRLKIDYEDSCLMGALPTETQFPFSLMRDGCGKDCHTVRELLRDWPSWLKKRQDVHSETAAALDELQLVHHEHLRKYRNRLVHGLNKEVNLIELRTHMLKSGLVLGFGQPFGLNFLRGKTVTRLLQGLDAGDLTTTLQDQLKNLLKGLIQDTHVQT